MPAGALPIAARLPSAPYPLINGTNPTTTTEPARVGAAPLPPPTPTSVPTPVFQSVRVVPAESITQTTTAHAEMITQYPGPQAELLQGYCSEPAYTILEGPDIALWVPVVGCISSRSECCPTSTGKSDAATTAGAGGDGGNGSGQQFPISFMPAQGTLTGCPKDYHTVANTACCPSSYWLWTTEIGGQVPCYSSLNAKMTPPPIPETLVHKITGTASFTSRTIETAKSQKPTSAVVNIAYAMQYPVVPIPKKALDKHVKIGVGVGVGVTAILIGLLIAVLVRKFCVQSRKGRKLRDSAMSQTYLPPGDMSHLRAEEVPNSRTYEGAKYVGVSTTAAEH